jgi:hypothetical protein
LEPLTGISPDGPTCSERANPALRLIGPAESMGGYP